MLALAGAGAAEDLGDLAAGTVATGVGFYALDGVLGMVSFELERNIRSRMDALHFGFQVGRPHRRLSPLYA